MQQGREIEIMNTFEIVVDSTDGVLMVDHAYFVTRKEQCELSTSSVRLSGGR